MKTILIVAASVFLVSCGSQAQLKAALPSATETSYKNETFDFSFSFPVGVFQDIRTEEGSLALDLATTSTKMNIVAYPSASLPEWRSLAEITSKGSPYKQVAINKKKAWQYGSYDDRDHWILYTAFYGKNFVYWIATDQPTKNTDKAFIDQVLTSFTFTP